MNEVKEKINLQNQINLITALIGVSTDLNNNNNIINSYIADCIKLDYIGGLEVLLPLLKEDFKLQSYVEALKKCSQTNNAKIFNYLVETMPKNYQSYNLNEIFNEIFMKDQNDMIKLGIDFLCRNNEDENIVLSLCTFFNNLEILDYLHEKNVDFSYDNNRCIKSCMIFNKIKILEYLYNENFDLVKIYDEKIVPIGQESEHNPPHDPSIEVSQLIARLRLKEKLENNTIVDNNKKIKAKNKM